MAEVPNQVVCHVVSKAPRCLSSYHPQKENEIGRLSQTWTPLWTRSLCFDFLSQDILQFHTAAEEEGPATNTVTGLQMFVRVYVKLHTVCVVFNVVSIYELTQSTVSRQRQQW